MQLVGDVLDDIVQMHFDRDDNVVHHVNGVLEAGIATIELVRKLHQAGYVHGDIHGGNVAVRDPGT